MAKASAAQLTVPTTAYSIALQLYHGCQKVIQLAPEDFLLRQRSPITQSVLKFTMELRPLPSTSSGITGLHHSVWFYAVQEIELVAS